MLLSSIKGMLSLLLFRESKPKSHFSSNNCMSSFSLFEHVFKFGVFRHSLFSLSFILLFLLFGLRSSLLTFIEFKLIICSYSLELQLLIFLSSFVLFLFMRFTIDNLFFFDSEILFLKSLTSSNTNLLLIFCSVFLIVFDFLFLIKPKVILFSFSLFLFCDEEKLLSLIKLKFCTSFIINFINIFWKHNSSVRALSNPSLGHLLCFLSFLELEFDLFTKHCLQKVWPHLAMNGEWTYKS